MSTIYETLVNSHGIKINVNTCYFNDRRCDDDSDLFIDRNRYINPIIVNSLAYQYQEKNYLLYLSSIENHYNNNNYSEFYNNLKITDGVVLITDCFSMNDEHMCFDLLDSFGKS